jgi:hypothetical protein
MRLACPEDFYNGPIYNYYRHHEGYAKRAQLFKHFPEPILVIGCGFGFLVKELFDLHKDAFGIDASLWAVEKKVVEQVYCMSALNRLPAAETVVTEDLLPCLSDEEAKIVAKNCDESEAIVTHLVTEHGEADLNYHSLGFWTNLTGQLVVSLEGM